MTYGETSNQQVGIHLQKYSFFFNRNKLHAKCSCMQLGKVEHAKTQNQHIKILHSEYKLILRMSTTLTSGSHDDFGSFTWVK